MIISRVFLFFFFELWAGAKRRKLQLAIVFILCYTPASITHADTNAIRADAWMLATYLFPVRIVTLRMYSKSIHISVTHVQICMLFCPSTDWLVAYLLLLSDIAVSELHETKGGCRQNFGNSSLTWVRNVWFIEWHSTYVVMGCTGCTCMKRCSWEPWPFMWRRDWSLVVCLLCVVL